MPKPRRPQAKGRKPIWGKKGTATHLEMGGARIPLTARRPQVFVRKEHGFDVYSRDIKPKKRKIVI